jgi:hypothetical protein
VKTSPGNAQQWRTTVLEAYSRPRPSLQQQLLVKSALKSPGTPFCES